MIMAVIAALSVVGFGKFIEKARYDNTRLNLIAIHSAVKIYAAKNNTTLIGADGIAAINTVLGLKIIDADFTYVLDGNGGMAFDVVASRNLPSGQTYTMRVTEAPISDTNPVCEAGACPGP
jgi:type II secretory pathway pseudopilin PulG